MRRRLQEAEYEVTIQAPDEPVQLGEKITAKIEARYYFGSPVTQATVKYKVLRANFTDRWYPPGPWDWLYGPGYGWLGYEYSWYPGWSQWGVKRPAMWWFPQPEPEPEVVAEVETAIGADGTVDVEIDTAVAKALHGDKDHRYTITAEVVDASRRTIAAQGKCWSRGSRSGGGVGRPQLLPGR